jgi:hypothetical protein
MTPCYYCEEDADVACRACIHSSTGPEIEQVIAWRAAPPPAADADATSRRAYEYAGDYAALAGGPMAPAADAVSEAMHEAMHALHWLREIVKGDANVKIANRAIDALRAALGEGA